MRSSFPEEAFLPGMNAIHSLFIQSCYKTDVTVDCFIVNFHGSKDQSLRQNVYKCWEQQVFTVLLQTTALTVSASPRGDTTHKGKYYKHSSQSLSKPSEKPDNPILQIERILWSIWADRQEGLVFSVEELAPGNEPTRHFPGALVRTSERDSHGGDDFS